jgi:hypothetical protein
MGVAVIPPDMGRFFGKSQKPPPYVASTTENPSAISIERIG